LFETTKLNINNLIGMAIPPQPEGRGFLAERS
jgi:hypothetical protein